MNTRKTTAADSPSRLTRRQFVQLGALGAASAAFAKDGLSTVFLPPAAATSFPMGFCQGSEHYLKDAQTGTTMPTDAMTSWMMMPADALVEGDPSFASKSARISISSMISNVSPDALRDVQEISLNIDYRPFNPVSFEAWRFQNALVPKQTTPMSLVVPVDSSTGLNLSWHIRQCGEPSGTWTTQRLGIGSDRHLPKLRCGIYCIALLCEGKQNVNWRRCTLHSLRKTSRVARAALNHVGNLMVDGEPAPFPYLVLSIAHAWEEPMQSALV